MTPKFKGRPIDMEWESDGGMAILVSAYYLDTPAGEADEYVPDDDLSELECTYAALGEEELMERAIAAAEAWGEGDR